MTRNHFLSRAIVIEAIVLAILGSAFFARTATTAFAAAPIENIAACTANSLGAIDDSPSATATFPAGMSVNFFGETFTQVYVNNNGNVTFSSALSAYSPSPLVSAGHKIIAPFWSDVDTRPAGTSPVTWGTSATLFEGRPGLCVNWINVGYYSFGADKLNSFQLLIVKAAGGNPGDFDIIMNYEKVLWDQNSSHSNTARAGYSNGSNVTYEISGSATPGAFLDTNGATGLKNTSEGGNVPQGRHLFRVRNGTPPSGGKVAGTVFKDINGQVTTVAGSPVFACKFVVAPPPCTPYVLTGSDGSYQLTNIEPGQWRVAAMSPANLELPTFVNDIIVIENGSNITGHNFTLNAQTGMPPNVHIDPPPAGLGGGGVPIILWNQPTVFTVNGCPGGGGSWTAKFGGATVGSGSLSGGAGGVYTFTLPAMQPLHGILDIKVDIICPDGHHDVTDISVFIDPSGYVKTVGGAPIVGAKVTLFRSDEANGTFVQVPNGSFQMSPTNRVNPDYTDATGHFGWDVIAGFYKVRAEFPGCTNPQNAGQAFVETAVLQIPEPVTNLDLRLNCPTPGAPLTSVTPGALKAGGGNPITLVVKGTGFTASSKIVFGGTERTTTFVNSTQLSTQISAADYAAPGSRDVPIHVTNLTGGGTSAVWLFHVLTLAPADTDCNGTVNATDALKLMRILAGYADGFCQSDPNGDGVLNILDPQVARAAAAGLIPQ